MQLKEAVKKRKSVRRYSEKRPDWRKIIRAIDSARYAPSAGGNFSVKFVLVDDEKKIAQIAAATQQDFVGTAKYIVVAVSDDSWLERFYGERGKMYARQQAGAAIENFLLALTEEGLVTSWVGHFYEDHVKNVLGIGEGLVVEAVFPIGVETRVKTKVKVKDSLENIIYFNKWKNKKMAPETRVGVEAV